MKLRSKARFHQKMEQLQRAGWGIIIASACVLGASSIADAQTVITPISNNRYYVELKDVSLSDALELIFKAAGNPDHRIDEAAKHYFISSLTLTNVDWYDAVLQLVNSKGFKLTRPNGSTYVVNPPAAPSQQNEWDRGRGVPRNPFAASLDSSSTIDTVANAQFGNRGGRNNNNNNNRNNNTNNNRIDPNSPPYGIENGTYQILLVNHIYAGGIARLFNAGTVVPTEELVYPQSTVGGSGNNNSNFSGGISGIGGNNNNNRNSNRTNNSSGGFGGTGILGNISDRNLKENFAAVDPQSVLDRINQMPITTWNYKFDDTKVRHLGPMAQDFAAAFGLGQDDRHIHSIDEGGASLAAIQALYRLVQQQSKEIDKLQLQVSKLNSTTINNAKEDVTPQNQLPSAP